MADFIRHLIAHGRPHAFADRVQQHQLDYYEKIAGQPNDIRISGNLRRWGRLSRNSPATSAPRGRAGRSAGDFVENELVVIRDATLSEVRDQQASEVFLAALGAPVRSGQARVDGYYPGYVISKGLDHKPVVGREVGKMASVEIATKIAIAAVQDLLARQRRPPLAVTEKTLIMQLAGDGKLLDKDDRPIDPKAGGDRTWSAKVAGETDMSSGSAPMSWSGAHGGFSRTADEARQVHGLSQCANGARDAPDGKVLVCNVPSGCPWRSEGAFRRRPACRKVAAAGGPRARRATEGQPHLRPWSPRLRSDTRRLGCPSLR